jgi:hypothetical protein
MQAIQRLAELEDVEWMLTVDETWRLMHINLLSDVAIQKC